MDDQLEILLVEDDLSDVRLTMRALRNGDESSHIEVVRDGEEALDFLFCQGAYSGRSPRNPPKLVLLDLKLPKVDGLQVLQAMRARPETRAIPVVALTSSREERDLAECYKSGINSYVQKPMNHEEFRDTIRALGLYWTTINQPPPRRLFSGAQAPDSDELK